MIETIQTPFIVERDGEIDPELSVLPPSGLEAAAERVRGAFGRFTGHIALQARMATFDALHGTNYRHIRNELVEQQKRRKFEQSIGIIAIDRK
jgi:hypothetical protein